MTLKPQNNQNISSTIRKSSLPLDIFFLFFKYILIILMVVIISAYSINDFIYAAIFGIITAFLLFSAMRDTASIYYYIKGRKYVNGLYLRGTIPQCPFLKVDASGFKCTVEFQRPFSMVDDFPRCHIEEKFKQHWLEKNTGLLDHASKETAPLNLRQQIEAIAVIKRPESADFLLEIVTAPNWSSMHDFFVKNLPQIAPVSEKEFHNMVINQFFSTIVGTGNKNEINIPLQIDNNEDKNKTTNILSENDAQNANIDTQKAKIESLYHQVLNQFLSNGMLSLSPNQELLISSSQEFYSKSMILKGRNNPIVRQYALQALGILKDPRAIPHLLALLGTDRRTDRIIVNILASMGDKAIESLKLLITDPNSNLEKRYSAIEVLGMMRKKELYDFLLQTYLSIPQDDELAKSYLLSALGESDPERGLEISIKSYYDRKESDLIQDAAKKTILDNIFLCLPMLFQKLEELPDGELTDEQEYIRVNTVIIIEDMDIHLLKKWMVEQGPTERSKYITIMNREGLEIVAKRLKI